MDGRDLAKYCIEFAENLGIEYAEARFEKSMTRGFAFRNGEPVSGGTRPLSGIGVRLLVDGSFGFASFDRLEKDLAENTIRIAHKMAKNTKRKHPIKIGDPISNNANWKVKVKENLADVDIDTIMDTTKILNDQMQGLDSFMLTFNPLVNEKYIVTNEGTEIDAKMSQILASAIMTAKGKTGSEQRFLDLSMLGGWERIGETGLVEYLSDEVRRLQNAAERAEVVKEVMEKPVDMVVGSEVSGIISHENVGHPSEGVFWRNSDSRSR